STDCRTVKSAMFECVEPVTTSRAKRRGAERSAAGTVTVSWRSVTPVGGGSGVLSKRTTEVDAKPFPVTVNVKGEAEVYVLVGLTWRTCIGRMAPSEMTVTLLLVSLTTTARLLPGSMATALGPLPSGKTLRVVNRVGVRGSMIEASFVVGLTV